MFERYERLKASIATVGLIQIGTLTRRLDRRADASGRVVERGPYYQWTFKEKGKTRTVNLSAEQAPQWKRAIANRRRLQKIEAQMLTLSSEILRATTVGVATRKGNRATPKDS